jgi:hypothetical protein
MEFGDGRASLDVHRYDQFGPLLVVGVREVRTDNGHEFQAKFHWHVEDQASVMPTSSQVRLS